MFREMYIEDFIDLLYNGKKIKDLKVMEDEEDTWYIEEIKKIVKCCNKYGLTLSKEAGKIFSKLTGEKLKNTNDGIDIKKFFNELMGKNPYKFKNLVQGKTVLGCDRESLIKKAINIGEEIYLNAFLNNFLLQFYNGKSVQQELHPDFCKIIDDPSLDSLDDLEKIRKIYYKLNTILAYSPTFRALDENKMFKIIWQIANKKIIDISSKENEIICTQWAEIYCSLLNKVNIPARVVGYGHKYVLILTSEGLIQADATRNNKPEEMFDPTDLVNSKTGEALKGMNFIRYAPSDELIFDRDVFKGIDEKLGISCLEEEELAFELSKKFARYFSKERLSEKLYGLNSAGDIESLQKKFEFILKRMNGLKGLEAYAYFKQLIELVFNKEEKQKINEVTILIPNDRNGKVELMQTKLIQIKGMDDSKLLWLNTKECKLEEITTSELVEKMIDGSIVLKADMIQYINLMDELEFETILNIPGEERKKGVENLYKRLKGMSGDEVK